MGALVLISQTGLIKPASADDITKFIPRIFLGTPNGIPQLDATGAVTSPLKGTVDSATVGGVPLSYIIPSLQSQNRLTESIPKSWLDVAGGVPKLDNNKILHYNLVGDVSSAYVSQSDGTTITLGNIYTQFLSSFYSVLLFGAAMDGITDDTTAFSLAKTKAAGLQTIYVPQGNTSVSSFPVDSTKVNFWELTGTTNKNALIDRVGSDPTETKTTGGYLYSRSAPINAGSLFTISREDGSTTDPGNGTDAVGQEVDCRTDSVLLTNAQKCVKISQKLYSTGTAQHTGQYVDISMNDKSGTNTGSVAGVTSTLTDNSGLPSSKTATSTGSILSMIMTSADDGSKRNGYVVNLKSTSLSTYASGYSSAFLASTDGQSYLNSVMTFKGRHAAAALDLSQSSQYTTSQSVSGDIVSGSVKLRITSTLAGISVGMQVSGTGIQAGSLITAIPDTGTIIISKPTTQDISNGATLSFKAIAPWASLGDSRILQFGDVAHRMVLGDDVDAAGTPSSLTSNSDTVSISSGTSPHIKFYSQDSSSSHTLIADFNKTGVSVNGAVSASGVIYQQMTQTQIDAISAPQIGQTVYNSTSKQLVTYNGTSWVSASIPASTYTKLPSTPYVGQVVYCADCYSKLRPYDYSGTGIHTHWDGTAWTDALGIPVKH